MKPVHTADTFSVVRFYLIAVSFVVIAAGWDSILIKPAKLLIVLVHEMWHGIIAMAGGVKLDAIVIHGDESGETLVSGRLGFFAFIASVSAGYIGTALTGATLLRVGLGRSYERTTLTIFTLLLFYMSFLFTEPGSTAYMTGLLSSLFCIVILFLGQEAAGKALVVLGSCFVFYSLFDLYDFTQPQTTDANILAIFLERQGYLTKDSWITPISILWTICIAAVVYLPLRSVHISADQPAPVADDMAITDEPQTTMPPAEPDATPVSEKPTEMPPGFDEQELANLQAMMAEFKQ